MEQKQHTCKLCNMSFKSGSVLGGHMRGNAARKSVKKQLLHGAAVMNLEASGIGSCDGGYDGLKGNPRGSQKETEFQLERSVQGRNLLEFLEFCPIRRKRSAQVFVSPSPSPSPKDSNWEKLPPMASPVSNTEQDVDEEAVLSLLLLSRGLRESHDQIKEETAPIAVPGFLKKVELTTNYNAEGCGHLEYPSREAEIGKRARGNNWEGSYGGSTKKPKLDHDWSCKGTNNQMKLKIGIKIACGDDKILCPTSDWKENVPEHTCRTCSKVFKSAKALYGHQRVH